MVGKLTGWGDPPRPDQSAPTVPDVPEPDEPTELERPALNSSRQAWADYLTAAGIVIADDETRTELIAVADSLGL